MTNVIKSGTSATVVLYGGSIHPWNPKTSCAVQTHHARRSPLRGPRMASCAR